MSKDSTKPTGFWSKKPTGSYEFSVPSTKDVHRVLISSVLAAIAWVILSMSESNAQGWWSLIGLMGMSVLVAVPCWGIVWLLLAAPSRSHSKRYYIRYRLTEVLAFTVYGSTLTASLLLPLRYEVTIFTDPERWALTLICEIIARG